ncbi:ATP synthase subunit s-like protein [Halocaridina rubra]|uniref:ATP synthase subunit s-like protein n=1 Tax=Halocaridina rubra TaxID=373956 RepID=A0AAN8ZUV8_HALRR
MAGSFGSIQYGLMKNACSCALYKSTRSFMASSVRLEEKARAETRPSSFGPPRVEERKKEQWTPVPEKWTLPKEEWKSFFHYFAPEKGITIDILHLLQKKIDLSPKAVKQWYQRWKSTKDLIDQSFLPERVSVLGCELAAAHFIVYRGGKVRAKGSNEWIVKDSDDNYDLPRHYTPGYFVEAIDAPGTKLIYEGLECLGNLEYLQWLNLSNCSHLDDWCMDRICGQYGSTLRYLNISNCPKITSKGITTCARLRELRTLDLTGHHNNQDIELICLLLEDVNPQLEIIGINYINSPKLQGNID